MKGLSKLSLSFAAGCLGGVTTSLVLYLCGALGLMEFYGVTMAPTLKLTWIYQQTLWGGLFGFFFAMPILERSSWLLSGLFYSLVPALAHLLIFYPLVMNLGLFGLKLGANTPYFVFGFSLLWGMITSWWFRITRS